MNHLMLSALVSLTAASMFAATSATRVILPERYAMGNVNVRPVQEIDSAAWLWDKDLPKENVFLLFRKSFTSDGSPCRIHLSADERFVLRLDGKQIARGPHRGTVHRWLYQTYDLTLDAGEHRLDVVVSRTGDNAPLAQLSWHEFGGFILKAEGSYDAQLTTGKAPWKMARLHSPEWKRIAFGTGQSMNMTGTSPYFAEPPQSDFIAPKVVRTPITVNKYGARKNGWMLFPSPLPDQMEATCRPGVIRAAVSTVQDNYTFQAADASHAACAEWTQLLRGNKPVTIPANTKLTVLWDLQDYYCAYPELRLSGGAGAKVTWGWAESLYGDKEIKGDRNTFAGKHFKGLYDSITCDGKEDVFAISWWRCGRWVRLLVETANEPLTCAGIALHEVHYPTPFEETFASDDASLDGILKICRRGMQMCSHEMGFDCPYYEQQMYPGDTRIQLLIQYALFGDDRLVRHDIDLFDYSRREDGRVGMNFPTRGTQESWTYTLIWPLMLHDYAMWRNNRDWLRHRIPGLQHTMEGARLYENADGLLENLPGWNFMDWTSWNTGISPDGDKLNCINNLFYLYALRDAAEIERAMDEPDMAVVYEKRAKRVAAEILRTFWDEKRGMLADTLAKDKFSEHVQSLAILLDLVSGDRLESTKKNLLEAKDLERCTVYFSHYLFEAYAKIGRTDLTLSRFDLWRGYVKNDLKTPLESPGNARSDCHAWGSHPLFQLHANFAGVRPAAPFFRTVRIAPQPGGLRHIQTKTPHPNGLIEQDLTFRDDQVNGTVILPQGLNGSFLWKGKTITLHPGKQAISL